MVIHILTTQGEQMVVQVVDGNVIVPQAPQSAQATRTAPADTSAGRSAMNTGLCTR